MLATCETGRKWIREMIPTRRGLFEQQTNAHRRACLCLPPPHRGRRQPRCVQTTGLQFLPKGLEGLNPTADRRVLEELNQMLTSYGHI